MDRKNILDEHFVPVLNYPNYEVSNYGRVINVKRGYEMTISEDKRGDKYIKLSRNGKQQTFQLKRLVAQAFFADFHPWLDVFLISEHKEDCSVTNITLIRPERFDSVLYATKHIQIIETGEIFSSVGAVVYRIGGQDSVIRKCLMGLGKTHKGYSFRWVEPQGE